MNRKKTKNVELNSSGELDVVSSPDSSFERSRKTNTSLLHIKMADNSEDDSENGDEDIANKIRKLEREKAKLEKQSLRQKYKNLKETVGSLKSASVSSSGISSGSGTSSSLHSPGSDKRRYRGSDTNTVNSSLSSVLGENRARLENLQKHGHSSRSRGGNSDHSDVSDEDQDGRNLDKVMSAEHKQKLQIHRDTLVESMIPDDIFNDLIANKVLTTADVGRIKEKNTREAINEGLLNNLIVRSDRAFYEFVRSLRKTLQGYLADLIDEQPSSSRSSRKQKRRRQIGELNVRLDCEEVLPSGKRKRQCSCKDVEEQVLLMAKEAYQKIRRRDHTPAAFEQFKKELSQTNDIIKDSVEVMNTLKMFCQHDNEFDGVYDGSVVFRICCNSLFGLTELWNFYTSGEMLDVLQTGLVTKTLLKICNARSIRLRVRIAEEEYLLCRRELENKEVYLGKQIARENCEFYHTRFLRSTTKTFQSVPLMKLQKGLPIFQDTEPRRAFKEIQKNVTIGRDGIPIKVKTECEKVPRISRKRCLYNINNKLQSDRNGIG